VASGKIAEIERLGNHPVLDFINTVNNRHAETQEECLLSFEDLVEWHELAGLITKASGRALREDARRHPRKAAAALATAIELRELLHDIFLALVRGRQPSSGELCDLNAALNRLRPCCLLAAGEQALEWRWDIDPGQPETLLGPLVESAAALLTSGRLSRIRECPAPHGCGWLFLDTSKNGSRNWCSMKTCGNLAKVRRHRDKSATAAPE